MEVRAGLVEGHVAELDDPVQVPAHDVRLVGVDVDRQVEEVRDRQRLARPRPGRLEDVEPFEDEDVGAVDLDVRVGDDVVGDVVVDGRAYAVPAPLDRPEEVDEGVAVVGLGESLALHEPAPLQLRVRIEEPVGRHQLHPRRRGPATQELAQKAGRRRLADRHRPGDADDEGGAALLQPEERRCLGVQSPDLGRVHLQERRQRTVDGVRLAQVDGVSQGGQAPDVGMRQGQWRRLGQRGPLVVAEGDHVRRRCG